MASDLQICTLAMVALGANPVSSFSPAKTLEEKTAFATFDIHKNSFLSMYEWNFNQDEFDLTPDAIADKRGWGYVFHEPPNLLSFTAFFDSSHSVVTAKHEAGRVYSNSSSVRAKFKKKCAPGDIPEYVVQALAFYLAEKWCEKISGEDKIYQKVYQQMLDALRIAKRVDTRENPPTSIITPDNAPWLIAHDSGTTNNPERPL